MNGTGQMNKRSAKIHQICAIRAPGLFLYQQLMFSLMIAVRKTQKENHLIFHTNYYQYLRVRFLFGPNINILLSLISFLNSKLVIWTNNCKPLVTHKKKHGTKWLIAGRNGMNSQ